MLEPGKSIGVAVVVEIESGNENHPLAPGQGNDIRVNPDTVPGAEVLAGTAKKERELERKAAKGGGISMWIVLHPKSLPLVISTMAKLPALCSLGVLFSLKDLGIYDIIISLSC